MSMHLLKTTPIFMDADLSAAERAKPRWRRTTGPNFRGRSESIWSISESQDFFSSSFRQNELRRALLRLRVDLRGGSESRWEVSEPSQHNSALLVLLDTLQGKRRQHAVG
jgi:hypothetical protein